MDQGIEVQAAASVAAGRARGGRATQEDAFVCLHDPASDARLLVLADGMGGDGAGELASTGVIEAALRLWQQGLWREQPGPLFLETVCQAAHAELRRRGEGLAGATPHSTVVALLLRGRRACWAHVGDSRLYRFRGTRCLGRTEDHSVAQLKVARGELAAEAMGEDADQHKLLRGLGGPQPPQVEHGLAALRPGHSFVLCSDGAWERLSTGELGRLARRRNLRAALHEALGQAVERGGAEGDNVSLIFARIGWVQWWRARGARWWARLSRREAVRAGDVGIRQA
ncbi:PP2C family protein-serine/threonine phosphatase [Frateuria terrea]|uniref:Serine/threonine protein phosphatase PrpC n=1 Tax=Frateuria terrea TaxID=529704 RepID=A0A1H6YMK8_9GAMM|nr:protein phosphatase 2C domain-containing protein [Frateuria terrea]SEJ42558.1 Serine/threonine protein phosphatase PrpC [Frateuria terrea]SFP73204.1 Serine/threonine protein phosphatase PrpC [Frateuria terrea]